MPSKQELEKVFNQLVARRDVLKGKEAHLTQKERDELEEVDATLGPIITVKAFIERWEQIAQAEQDIAKGNSITLRSDKDFEEFGKRSRK